MFFYMGFAVLWSTLSTKHAILAFPLRHLFKAFLEWQKSETYLEGEEPEKKKKKSRMSM